MKFTIRKYEDYGWQIWNSDEEPYYFDISGESDHFFIVALFRYWINLIKSKVCKE